MILDTSFLSSLFKIRKLELIRKFFRVDFVNLPYSVYEELKKAPFFDDLIKHIAFSKKEVSNDRWLLVLKTNNLSALEQDDLKNQLFHLGKGENEAILWAQFNKDVLLMDDKRAQNVAEKIGLKCYGIPTFLIACKKAEIIELKEIKKLIRDLKEKDYYEFSKEMEKALLKK